MALNQEYCEHQWVYSLRCCKGILRLIWLFYIQNVALKFWLNFLTAKNSTDIDET